jgi:hypothetical protein
MTEQEMSNSKRNEIRELSQKIEAIKITEKQDGGRSIRSLLHVIGRLVILE